MMFYNRLTVAVVATTAVFFLFHHTTNAFSSPHQNLARASTASTVVRRWWKRSDEEDQIDEIIETLSSTDWSKSLAILARAFAPSDQGLIHLKDIQSANVMKVDRNHIEISAILCELEGCLAVSVPISFPHSCENEINADTCILENIQELENEAESKIAQEEWNFDHAEEIQEEEQFFLIITEEQSTAHLPPWWLPTSPGEMNDECKSLKSLLNEIDFRQDLVSLATGQLQSERGEECAKVIQAGVSSIGPSGILLLARVISDHDHDFSSSSTIIHHQDQWNIIDVAFQFPKVANSADEIRSFVLDLIE